MSYNVIDKNNQINEGTFKTKKEAESFIDQLPGSNRRYGIIKAKNTSTKDKLKIAS